MTNLYDELFQEEQVEDLATALFGDDDSSLEDQLFGSSQSTENELFGDDDSEDLEDQLFGDDTDEEELYDYDEDLEDDEDDIPYEGSYDYASSASLESELFSSDSPILGVPVQPKSCVSSFLSELIESNASFTVKFRRDGTVSTVDVD